MPLSAKEALEIFFAVLAAIIGVPTIVVVVKAGMFFGSLAKSVRSLEGSATQLATRVEQIFTELAATVGDHEARIRVLEDRAGVDR